MSQIAGYAIRRAESRRLQAERELNFRPNLDLKVEIVGSDEFTRGLSLRVIRDQQHNVSAV